jgi:dolichyl-phosphate-mannose--protein O-mannosyl transferase
MIFFLFISLNIDKNKILVPFYSSVKLNHLSSNKFVSSIEINYIGGSFQQIVRGIWNYSLAETNWIIFPSSNQTSEIVCPAKVQFLHSVSQKFLHSHLIPDFFSQGNEISCFDSSDEGNLWYLECNDVLNLDSVFRIRHFIHQCYLKILDQTYDENQGGGFGLSCVNEGQGLEWKVFGGIFQKINKIN